MFLFCFFGAGLVDSTWRMETFNLKDGNFVVQNPPKSRGPGLFPGFTQIAGMDFFWSTPLPASEFWHGCRSCLRWGSGSLSRWCHQDGSNKNLDRKLTSKWVKNHRCLKFKRRSLSKNPITNVEEGCAKPSIIWWFRSFFEVEVHPPQEQGNMQDFMTNMEDGKSLEDNFPFRTRSKKSVTMWSTHLPLFRTLTTASPQRSHPVQIYQLPAMGFREFFFPKEWVPKFEEKRVSCLCFVSGNSRSKCCCLC